jgi:hypothetical protein
VISFVASFFTHKPTVLVSLDKSGLVKVSSSGVEAVSLSVVVVVVVTDAVVVKAVGATTALLRGARLAHGFSAGRGADGVVVEVEADEADDAESARPVEEKGATGSAPATLESCIFSSMGRTICPMGDDRNRRGTSSTHSGTPRESRNPSKAAS